MSMTETSFSEPLKQNIDQNGTLNTFLNDLYETKLDLNARFTDQEIGDIREAAKEQVKHIVQRIGEIEPRLEIAEIIPVGSARERTQVMRPCEYDFIIMLDRLSKPGCISLTDAEKGFVKVKLEDIELLPHFKDIVTSDGFVRGTNSFFHQGLRQLMDKTIDRVLCDRSAIQKDTGTLTCRPQRPIPNGVAIPITLMWTSIANKRQLLISVDLCPALKVYDVKNFLASEIHECYSDYSTQLESVLVMPLKPLHFRVTFTEMEVRLTADMSEHHKKCYRAMKYLINGEPYPLENNEFTLLKCLKDTRTNIKSYMLKLAMWNHHYVQQCPEDSDLGFCVSQVLESLQFKTFEHPFSRKKYMEGYELEVAQYHRLQPLQQCFQTMSETPKEDYSYENSFGAIEKVGQNVWLNIRSYIPDVITLVFQLTLLAFFIVLSANVVETYSTEKTVLVIIYMTSFCLYVLFSLLTAYVRNKILSLCCCRLSEFQTDVLMLSVTITTNLCEIIVLFMAIVYTKEGVFYSEWVIPVLVLNMFLSVLTTLYNAFSLPSVRRKKTSDLYEQMHFDQYRGFPCFPCGPIMCYPHSVYPNIYQNAALKRVLNDAE